MFLALLRRSLLAALLLVTWSLPLAAQDALVAPPTDWVHLDLERDGVAGMSTYRAFDELLAGRTPVRSVVVAVIDSGVDLEHDGLAGRIWINPREVAGTGRDDDGNGYVDDVHGWNFIGGPDGRHVDFDTFEYAREVARLAPRFDGVTPADLPPAEQKEYAHYRHMQERLLAKQEEYTEYLDLLGNVVGALEYSRALLTEYFGREDYAIDEVEAIDTRDPQLMQAVDLALLLHYNDLTEETVMEEGQSTLGRLQYSLNPDFDPRHIVGDNYDDVTERFYGNADVAGPDPSHGTSVAGAIVGRRDAPFEAYGVATDSVFIMAVRAVPNGDERDKDVANAIRYAVDNGAHIINMSFGKSVSPQREVVDEAIRHAMSRGVLMVHAAGNDGRDVETEPSFPNRVSAAGEVAELWIGVGASSVLPEALVAPFSNFGLRQVDVFAPGEGIRVLHPGNESRTSAGTSLAAPHVSGLAALLMSYYPQLSAAQVRQIILESASPLGEVEVVRPGTEDDVVRFGEFSATGGIINVYEAVRRAEALTTR
jgi:subtilisin family serine protease